MSPWLLSILIIAGCYIFAAAVGAMSEPTDEQKRRFYGWLYRFLQTLAVNVEQMRRAYQPSLPAAGTLPALSAAGTPAPGFLRRFWHRLVPAAAPKPLLSSPLRPVSYDDIHAAFHSTQPAPQDTPMTSPFITIGNGLTKAANFILAVFTKTKQVEDTFVALEPTTKAAVLASAYDVLKTIQAAEAAAGAATLGNVPLTITLSAQTLALARTVLADAKTDGSVFAADLKALGL